MIFGAYDQTIDPGIDRERQFGLRAGDIHLGAGFGHQARQQLRHFDGRGVFQFDDIDFGVRWHVDRLNNFIDASEVFGVVGDDQRVVVGIGVDDIIRRDQGTQHGQELRRRFVFQHEYLGDHLIALVLVRAFDQRRVVELGVSLGNDLDHAGPFNGGEALQAQRGQQNRVDQVLGYRIGRDDIDRAGDARIEDEILAGDQADTFHHRLNIGADKIQSDFVSILVLVGGVAGKRQRHERDTKKPRKSCVHKQFHLLLTDIIVKLQWCSGAQAFHFDLPDLPEMLIQAHQVGLRIHRHAIQRANHIAVEQSQLL